ncbi:MAG: biotin--[acetyl-CoA-carboxylase] ligase [Desulfobacterales bacterium]|jgi:BirA family biotin operon repressor/biotin-[acetyl-CoA-carboxylase] ligase
MKGQILKILRNNEGMVSGQALSAELGISRVSIWKHIQKLKALGYEILATAKGYRLENSPDVPYPWEFPDWKFKIAYYPELTSTMEAAKNLARENCPHFTTVVAGRQISGRGRLNRGWISEEGGLYFTMVLRPDIPPVLSFRISFLASLTMAGILREMFDIDANVKWPNDILINEHKVSGMLSELEAETDRVVFINIGIGLNVNNNPSPNVPAATSLKKILGREISKKDILARYLDVFEHRLRTTAFDRVIEEWKQYTVTLNRDVHVVTTHDVFTGKAVDVDDTGALIIRCADGSLQTIRYGDCFHQSPLAPSQI